MTHKLGFVTIDPGLTGGIAHGTTCDTFGWKPNASKMPVIREKTKKVIDYRELFNKVRTLVRFYQNRGFEVIGGIEKVHAMPGQGVSSTFTFGMGYGHARMALMACDIPVRDMRPQEWMVILSGQDKSLGKKRSVAYCKAMHPHLPTLSDGEADAVAMVDYLVMRYSKNGDSVPRIRDDSQPDSTRPAT